MKAQLKADKPHVHAESAPELPDSGIVLTDTSLQTFALDAGAVGILRYCGYNGSCSAGAAPSIPVELAEAIRRHSPANDGAVFPFQIGDRRYRCRSYVVESHDPALGPKLVVVHLDSDHDSSEAIRELAQEYHLTEREAEALRGIALGLTTKELAGRMKISPNTVKSFVRLIMIKLGVATRTAIMVKLLERGEGK